MKRMLIDLAEKSWPDYSWMWTSRGSSYYLHCDAVNMFIKMKEDEPCFFSPNQTRQEAKNELVEIAFGHLQESMKHFMGDRR